LNIFRKYLKDNKLSIYRFKNENKLKEFFIPKRKYDPINEIEMMASEPMSEYNRHRRPRSDPVVPSRNNRILVDQRFRHCFSACRAP
jgi:hypothetical protein